MNLSHRRWIGALLLLILNGFIAWPLFRLEIGQNFGSVEPIFYAIAKAIKERWPDLGWWPYWNLGMPAEYMYQPLLHHLVAAVSGLTGLNEIRSFHIALALLYCLGPIALYALMLRLTGRLGLSLSVSLAYSLFSPSALLIESIRRDMEGTWLIRRLHTATIYGDGPYVTGLTFIPLAILFLDRAIAAPSPRRWALAAIAIILVPLTNIPAALSLAMALAAFALAFDWRSWWRRVLQIAAIAATGYALFAPWMPPSGLLLMAHNVQWMNPDGRFTTERMGFYLLFLIIVVGAAISLNRWCASFYFRFAVLFSLITSVVVLLHAWFGIALIGQASRFHLVMEMALVMLLGALVSMIRWNQRALQIAAVAISIAVLFQARHLYRFSKRINTPATDFKSRSEYKVAQWMSRNAQGARVFVPGSTSFWLNYWTDTPQMTGCCEQNTMVFASAIAKYVFGTDHGGGKQIPEVSIAWMQALGIRYIDISSEGSTEVYKDFHYPKTLDGVLPERWRDPGEVIYEVPGVSSFAHVLRLEETVSRMPIHGLDIKPLENYVRAITDENRPIATFEWTGNRTAIIRSVVKPGEVVSVQIPFHAGWKAASPEGQVMLSKDALGFLLLQPNCNGNCEIQLRYDSGTEALILRVIAIGAWLILAAVLSKQYWPTRRIG